MEANVTMTNVKVTKKELRAALLRLQSQSEARHQERLASAPESSPQDAALERRLLALLDQQPPSQERATARLWAWLRALLAPAPYRRLAVVAALLPVVVLLRNMATVRLAGRPAAVGHREGATALEPIPAHGWVAVVPITFRGERASLGSNTAADRAQQGVGTREDPIQVHEDGRLAIELRVREAAGPPLVGYVLVQDGAWRRWSMLSQNSAGDFVLNQPLAKLPRLSLGPHRLAVVIARLGKAPEDAEVGGWLDRDQVLPSANYQILQRYINILREEPLRPWGQPEGQTVPRSRP